MNATVVRSSLTGPNDAAMCIIKSRLWSLAVALAERLAGARGRRAGGRFILRFRDSCCESASPLDRARGGAPPGKTKMNHLSPLCHRTGTAHFFSAFTCFVSGAHIQRSQKPSSSTFEY